MTFLATRQFAQMMKTVTAMRRRRRRVSLNV
jgi:hypothetical protein